MDAFNKFDVISRVQAGTDDLRASFDAALTGPEAIDLSKEQRPVAVGISCVDSRYFLPHMLNLKEGQLLPHKLLASFVGDFRKPTKMSMQSMAFLALAVEKLGVRNVVVMPHSRCGGLQLAADYLDIPSPDDFSNAIMWQWAQTQRNLFTTVRKNGADHYLGRTNLGFTPGTEEQRFVEVEHCVRMTRMVQETVLKLAHGRDVTVTGIHLDLDSISAHRVTLHGTRAGDWNLMPISKSRNVVVAAPIERLPAPHLPQCICGSASGLFTGLAAGPNA